ncbi:BadF/BadG/BcrA/BcrD ATPase family protein [Streptomyces sp. NPDC059679]|uniref:BadF/BadG/BcrA/BcrD ATPase family protein n=1 Tax=Streptomyces sp. NPDC059679 TaxID=3346903 RepID=UPI0036850674
MRDWPSHPSHPPVLGIDIGGTKTHLAVGADGSGTTAEHIVRTASWRSGSAERDAVGLRELTRKWLGNGALSWPTVVGANGCDTTEQCDAFAAALGDHFTGPLQVVNDAELMPPAMGVANSIGVVCGTGSIATARDAEHRLVTAGGWGWLLGDEGSAAGLVREAARAVLGAVDCGAPLDELSEHLLRAFGAATPADLSPLMSADNSAESWGSRAPAVFAAAEEGSAMAAAVIEEGAEQLASLVDQLAARGIVRAHLVAGGTVIRAQHRLREAFVNAVRRNHPHLDIRILDRPPVLGALALAAGPAPAARPTLPTALTLSPSVPSSRNCADQEVNP